MTVTGMYGYTGDSFEDIVRGETIPFSFQFMKEDEVTPIVVTGWKVYISFTSEVNCDDAVSPDLEVVLLPQDADNGIISGYISDDETFSLPEGTIYGSIKWIEPDDRTYIIDMGKLKVYPCINPRRDQ